MNEAVSVQDARQTQRAYLSVCFFGSFSVSVDGLPVQRWRAGKSRSFFQYLALHRGRLMTRDQLRDALWPDAEWCASSSSLKVAGQLTETATVLAAIPGTTGYLSAPEQRRAASFRRDRDRDDFIAAHALVRVVAGALLGQRPAALTVVQTCPQCGGPHGVPRLRDRPEVHLSMSHAYGFVAAAASHTPIGVDVEVVRRHGWDPDVASLALSPAELGAVGRTADPQRAFVRQWVRKEALVKVGVVELDDLTTIELPVDEDEPPVLGQQGPPIRWRDWALSEWTAGPDGAAAGCVAIPRNTTALALSV